MTACPAPDCLNGCGGARSDCPERLHGKDAQRQLGGVTGKGFMPGQSGNPGGMPKGMAEVKALARKHTTEAITTLATIMKDTDQPGATRVRAIEVLLDRGWGKALTPVVVDDQRPLAQVPAERLLAALQALETASRETIEGEAEAAGGGP